MSGAIRNLNLHEFPSMELMKEHGIRTPRAFLASDPEEARDLFRRNFTKGMYAKALKEFEIIFCSEFLNKVSHKSPHDVIF